MMSQARDTKARVDENAANAVGNRHWRNRKSDTKSAHTEYVKRPIKVQCREAPIIYRTFHLLRHDPNTIMAVYLNLLHLRFVSDGLNLRDFYRPCTRIRIPVQHVLDGIRLPLSLLSPRYNLRIISRSLTRVQRSGKF
ncbi:hypothetical protein BU23DRAFT_633384 [Bimuria novae-zelandiae CBS 107.79]|uniref:Uncharacterized protein n=1 Tax=Bimuria novae-zelandiae CBS 107.79 TaxID=1447943 RepID=A0A6A5VD32_9PLEO|nr:hypothetical protein BU23DRAFT_633384 [Bimuria novae-zelandiae CBS 107.79]